MAEGTQPQETTVAKTVAKATTKIVVEADEVGLGSGVQRFALLRGKAGNDAANVTAHPEVEKPSGKHSGEAA